MRFVLSISETGEAKLETEEAYAAWPVGYQPPFVAIIEVPVIKTLSERTPEPV